MKLPVLAAWITLLAAPAVAEMRAADLLPAIEAALIAQGAPAGAIIELAAPDMPLADDVTISALSYNAASGRFIARGANVVIAGTARAAVETPVLIAALARGEIIAANNIAYEPRAAASGAIIDEDALIGMEARRNLAAGAPLRRSDVAPALLVKRNAAVTVTYEAPGLTLAQSGAARANGALGDLVEIETKGGRVIRAVVTGANSLSLRSRP